jgi:mono/diheme cytochrome c family protein
MAAKPEPGRDPQMAERTNRLNLVFALSSLGLLLALSLMVWADYDREWKRYQLDFNALEVRSMRAERDAAAGKVDATRRQQLTDLIARAEQEAAAGRDEIRKLEAELNRQNGIWYRVDQEYRFTKARIDVARYEYEEAGHKKSGSTGKKKAHLDELEKDWNERRLELEKVIAERDAVAAKLKALRKTQLEAEQKQKELFGERDRLDQSLRKIEPGLVSFVRNLPVLDLANPSLKVNQILPPNLYDDVIFSPTPKVDRCTTCHLGIDKRGHEKDPQPYRTHPDFETFLRGPHPIERIGCTACHQGRGRATGFQEAVHTASTRDQEKDWGRYTGTKEYDRWHLWDYPMLAKGHTESQCAKCHQGVVEVPKAERLNTGLFLVERYGCFGCHKIKGWEGLRKVGPDLSKIASKTDPEWMFRWIKEPKSFRPTRMPQIWDVRIDETEDHKARNNVEVNAVVAYIAGKSAKVPYPAPPTGDAVSGRKTFETVGCLACHRIGPDERGIEGLAAASFRTHGPNLDGTGSKVNPAWLYSWLRNPKAYWHDTKMPNLRLTEKEAADVTAYLMSLTNDDFVSRPRPAMDATVRDTIVLEYLKSQQTVAQAQEKLAGMNDEARTLFLGEKTIGRYGCFGCHETPGFEKASPIGVELTEEGSKLVERLDFGFEEGQIPHNLPAWVHRKLMEPRVFDRGKDKKPDELLRMPKFHFQPEEAEAIVTGVLSFTKEQIPLAAQKQLSADERYVEKGRRVVRTLNCQGCHVIGKGGAVRAVIESQLEASGGDMLQASALAPPQLYNEKARIGEGARAQTPWLHSFLRDPSTPIRPWLQIRMPSFDLAEDELNTITHYFAAQDRVPYPYDPKPALDPSMVAAGKDLFVRWQCVKCHVVAGKLPNQEPANMAPDLAKVPERLRADWLTLWLADPGRIMPGTRMPSNFPADAQENAYPEVLGGDQKKQIEAVRAYLLTLGKGSAAGAGPIATSR